MSDEQDSVGVRAAIVGAGSIGVAWAIVFARAGWTVRLFDIDGARSAAAVNEAADRLAALDAACLLDEDIALILRRIETPADLASALNDVDYVQECVIESLEVKRAVFAELDRLVPSNAVLASSTSMIPCSRFAAELTGRERCLVVHPGNPPYLLPVAEIVPAPFSSTIVIERARELLAAAGMACVVVRKELEGFVFNRLQGALLREAYCLVRDGVVSAREIDVVVSHGLGRRWSVLGPFATAELNTRGGIERHAELLGPAYARMGAERGQTEHWEPELVKRVSDDIHQVFPPERWAESVLHRDQALMHLERARRGATDDFDGLGVLAPQSNGSNW